MFWNIGTKAAVVGAAAVFVLLGVASKASALVLEVDVYNYATGPDGISAEIDITCDGSGCWLAYTNVSTASLTGDPPPEAAGSAINQIYFEEGFGESHRREKVGSAISTLPPTTAGVGAAAVPAVFMLRRRCFR